MTTSGLIDGWEFLGVGKEMAARSAAPPGGTSIRLSAGEKGMYLDSEGGLFIPDRVLAEWLRRKGWSMSSPPSLHELLDRLDGALAKSSRRPPKPFPGVQCDVCRRVHDENSWKALRIVTTGRGGETRNGKEVTTYVTEERICHCDRRLMRKIPHRRQRARRAAAKTKFGVR